MARSGPASWFGGNRRTRIIDRAEVVLPLCTGSDVPKEAPKVVHSAVARANSHRFGAALRNVVIMTIVYLAIFSGGNLLSGRNVADAFGSAAVYGVLWCIGAVLAGMLSRASIDAAGRRALAECLRARLCPSCCYDLSGTAPGADTFVRCPECGGTWPGPLSARTPV